MTRVKNPAKAKLRKSPATGGESLEAVPYQLRLDADLHGQLKSAAETAGISLNQLIQGICRGAMAHIVQGEAQISPHGFVSVKPQRGCVFFGRAGEQMTEEEEYLFETKGILPSDKANGEAWFGLDFTNRGVVTFGRA